MCRAPSNRGRRKTRRTSAHCCLLGVFPLPLTWDCVWSSRQSKVDHSDSKYMQKMLEEDVSAPFAPSLRLSGELTLMLCCDIFCSGQETHVAVGRDQAKGCACGSPVSRLRCSPGCCSLQVAASFTQMTELILPSHANHMGAMAPPIACRRLAAILAR